MTPEAVRERKRALDHLSRELKRQQDHLQIEYKHLQLDCEHPNQRRASCMGELSMYCPDCGRDV